MAEIPGATIDFVDYIAPTTPRVLNIPAAAGSPVAQDIWDTISAEFAKLDNLIYKKGLDRPKGGGKSTLDVGKATGIVVPMNNLQIQLEPQVTKLETGTVTTPDTAGKLLTDSAATFVTNLVARGDISLNSTDGSHATVLRVLGETSLVSTPLLGGTDNQYDSADSYEILQQDQRAITDGDVISQDHLGDPLNPVLTAFGVDTTRELSTSPALVESGVSGLTPTESAQLTAIDGQLALIEGTFDHKEAMRLILAATAGDLSGAGTTTIEIKDTTGATIRIRSTADTKGNRTVTLLDVS